MAEWTLQMRLAPTTSRQVIVERAGDTLDGEAERGRTRVAMARRPPGVVRAWVRVDLERLCRLEREPERRFNSLASTDAASCSFNFLLL